MIALTGYTTPNYLINRKFISRDEFFKGEWVVEENFIKSTRNANFKIDRKNARPLFVKQPRSFNHIEGGLNREIQFYQQFGSSLAAAQVSLLPKQYLDKYDEVNQILIFDFVANTREYKDLIINRYAGTDGEALTQLGGRQVRTAHALTIKSQLPARHPFQSMMPWLLTVQEVYLTEMTESDKVSIARLGRWLLSNSCILNYLAKAWNESHIIHGDLHWQNLLVANADSETPELRMIDWEFAALGDPFWDVATLLSDYLIQSVTANGQITPDRLPILMSILIKASMGQTDYASLRRIIQLTGLATLQQYTQWIINKLPFSVKSNELYEQATRYLTNPDSVLEAWSTL